MKKFNELYESVLNEGKEVTRELDPDFDLFYQDHDGGSEEDSWDWDRISNEEAEDDVRQFIADAKANKIKLVMNHKNRTVDITGTEKNINKYLKNSEFFSAEDLV